MPRRAKAAAKAVKAKERTLRSATTKHQRRKSSTRFPPPPTAEDVASDGQDELAYSDEETMFDEMFNPTTTGMGSKRGSEIYFADNEGSCGPRRFSDLYGHGHQMEETLPSTVYVPSQKPTLSSNKRKASDLSENISKKRVRFNSNANETKEFSKYQPASPRKTTTTTASGGQRKLNSHNISGSITDEIDGAMLEDLDHETILPSNPDQQLLNIIREHPEALSLGQISGLFKIIQDLAHDLSRQFFGKNVAGQKSAVDQAVVEFPLHELQVKYPALYWTTLNVLDASTTNGVDDGWLKFFTSPNHRPFLVYAILGEWLTQRVFKDTAFGLSPNGREKMHDEVDVAYLYHDPFVRAKERSKIIAKSANMHEAQSAIGALADELMIVLAPIVQKSIDGTSARANEYRTGLEKHRLRASLVNLIEHCTALNWSVILSAENNTLVRVAEKLEKGKRFWATAPMQCINKAMINSTRDDSLHGKNERVVVKMTCWGRIEALTGHGMDSSEMAALEVEARDPLETIHTHVEEGGAIDGDELDDAVDPEKFCWECSNYSRNWDVLPEELWRQETEKKRKFEQQVRIAKLQRNLRHRQAKQKKMDIAAAPTEPDDSGDDPDRSDDGNVSDDHESSSSSMTDVDMHDSKDPKDKEEPLRGSWVTFYSCLNPHQVYCEWVKTEKEYKDDLLVEKGIDAEQEPIRVVNGLANTVKLARANLPFGIVRSHVKSQDILIKAWNGYCEHSLEIEWIAVLVATLLGAGVGMYKGGVFTAGKNLTTASINLAFAGVKGVAAGSKTVIDMVAAGVPGMTEMLRAAQANASMTVHHFNQALNQVLGGILDAGSKLDGLVSHQVGALLSTIRDILPKPSKIPVGDPSSTRLTYSASRIPRANNVLSDFLGHPAIFQTTTSTPQKNATVVATVTSAATIKTRDGTWADLLGISNSYVNKDRSGVTPATTDAVHITEDEGVAETTGFWHQIFDISNPHPAEVHTDVTASTSPPTTQTTPVVGGVTPTTTASISELDPNKIEINEMYREAYDQLNGVNAKFSSYARAFTDGLKEAKNSATSKIAKEAAKVTKAAKVPRVAKATSTSDRVTRSKLAVDGRMTITLKPRETLVVVQDE